jgi:hypothetical protein
LYETQKIWIYRLLLLVAAVCLLGFAGCSSIDTSAGKAENRYTQIQWFPLESPLTSLSHNLE